MGATKIEWTDATWNPIRARRDGRRGHFCVKISPGCANCYASTMQRRFGMPAYGGARERQSDGSDGLGRSNGGTYLDEEALRAPLRWKAPRMVFVCSMTDLFGEWVVNEWIDKIFAVMALCPQHTFQVLTKRAERMAAYMVSLWHRNGCPQEWNKHIPIEFLEALNKRPAPWPLPNVWLGVSAEDQPRADERIPHLLRTPAAVRWVSAEPLLGPIDLWGARYPCQFPVRGRAGAISVWQGDQKVSWVVVGGESGAGARPCKASWVRSIVRQCRAAEVPCFVKQLGRYVVDRNDAGFEAEIETYASGPLKGLPTDQQAWPTPVDVEHDLDGTRDGYQGAPVRVHLNNLKGGDPDEWPMDLRVREWPRKAMAGG